VTLVMTVGAVAGAMLEQSPGYRNDADPEEELGIQEQSGAG